MAIKWQTDELCVACGAWTENGNCFHHILTRGAHKEYQNESWNKIPTCFKCHIKHDSPGISWMAQKYPSVKKWLEDNGWQLVHGSWTPPVWL